MLICVYFFSFCSLKKKCCFWQILPVSHIYDMIVFLIQFCFLSHSSTNCLSFTFTSLHKLWALSIFLNLNDYMPPRNWSQNLCPYIQFLQLCTFANFSNLLQEEFLKILSYSASLGNSAAHRLAFMSEFKSQMKYPHTKLESKDISTTEV